MVSLEGVQSPSTSTELISSPRISFSAENNFISISPNSQNLVLEQDKPRNGDNNFEFLSSNVSSHTMLTADELFFEGKLLPFWKMQKVEKLNNINLKAKDTEQVNNEEESRVNWFVDDDPSPRPPTCTVLWKELLRLKKQRASSLSPSSSSSSSSSSSLADISVNEGKQGLGNNEKKHVKKIKKGLERTRSTNIRIRPMINVPPLFPLKKGKLER